MKPPTMEEAAERGLVAEDGKGVHMFSNGDAWDRWSSSNCDQCAHWNADACGDCAFEGYAFLRLVTPDLARLFGWIERENRPGSFTAPEQCAFFTERSDDEDGDRTQPPFVDPTQLTFIPPDGFPTGPTEPAVKELVSA